MTDIELVDWLLVDADRCASVVADAYNDWDGERRWRETLVAEIEYRERTEQDRESLK